MAKERTCGDCGCKEGELHLEGCDMERCSVCAKQVLAWGKCPGAKPEPFFDRGFSCKRCGEFIPAMVMLPDELWIQICGGTYSQTDILCNPCMEFIAEKRGITLE